MCARDSSSLEFDHSNIKILRIVATTSPSSSKTFLRLMWGIRLRGFRASEMQLLHHESRTRGSAARKAGVDPDFVREMRGRKICDRRAAAAGSEERRNRFALAQLAVRLHARARFKNWPSGVSSFASASGRFDETSRRFATTSAIYREQAAGRVGQDRHDRRRRCQRRIGSRPTPQLDAPAPAEGSRASSSTVDEVRETWGRIMRGIRQFVLALPGKIAFEVPTLNPHDRGVIERICRDGSRGCVAGAWLRLWPIQIGDEIMSPTND